MKMVPKPVAHKKTIGKDGKAKKSVVGQAVLVEKVAKKVGYAKKDVAEVLRAVFAVVGDQAAKGRSLRLPGVGTLEAVERQEKIVNAFGRGNVVVPARKTVRFRPAKGLKRI
ncbi:MAG: HU family DNA-binding protein [Bacillota bacterium]